MKKIKSWKLFTEALTPYVSLDQYGVTPEEFRKEVDRAVAERNLEIDRLNKLAEITDEIRYDKLTSEEIMMLIKQATKLGDTKLAYFLKRMPHPKGKVVKDERTRELLKMYMSL